MVPITPFSTLVVCPDIYVDARSVGEALLVDLES